MPVLYDKNKIHIYNYVDTHREQYNAYQVAYRIQYVKDHREHCNEQRRGYYNYKKSCNYEEECKRFRKICL